MSSTFEILGEVGEHDPRCLCGHCLTIRSYTTTHRLRAQAFERIQSGVLAEQADEIRQLRKVLSRSICDCVIQRTQYLRPGEAITVLAGHEPACKYRLVLEALGHV